MINLDTHVLVHALAGTLTTKERRVLEAEPWGVSGIVLWELAKLVQLKRLDLDLEASETRSRSRWKSRASQPNWTSRATQPTS